MLKARPEAVLLPWNFSPYQEAKPLKRCPEGPVSVPLALGAPCFANKSPWTLSRAGDGASSTTSTSSFKSVGSAAIAAVESAGSSTVRTTDSAARTGDKKLEQTNATASNANTLLVTIFVLPHDERLAFIAQLNVTCSLV